MAWVRFLLASAVLLLGSACTSVGTDSYDTSDSFHLPPEWTLATLPGAQADVLLNVLKRRALAPPARYRVVVVPGSGCTGWLPVAARYFAGLLHAELLVLHKPYVNITAGLGADCPPDFVAQDTLASWREHARAALQAHFAQSAPEPENALPVLLIGISEGAELLPFLADSVPSLTGVVMLSAPGLDPREAGALLAQQAGQWPAWQALQNAQASGLPDAQLFEGRTLGYWRDFWRWQLTQPLLDGLWPLLRVWGDADELVAAEAYQRFGQQAQTRAAPFCDWRLPGANHGLQSALAGQRDGVQWLWARLEVWARNPAPGLCASLPI